MRGSRTDTTFLALLGILLAFGFIALTSASGPIAYQRFGDAYWYVKHQVLFGLLPGLALFFITSRMDHRVWRRIAKPVFMVAVALLVAVFIPGIGAPWGTSRSWIGVGNLSFQPIEFAKFALLVYMAAWLERRGPEGLRDWREGLAPFLVTFGALALLVVLQPDLGGLTVLVAIAYTLYFLAGAPWRHLAGLAAGGAVALGILIKSAPYRAARLMTFLHPELDPQGIGYHINQAFLAIGSGGLLGLGLGHSRQKYMYLPEVIGDSVFAVIAEELGFIVTACVLALIAAFVLRIVSIARRSPDPFGRLLCAGAAGWVFGQTFMNVGSMVGLMPITGLPLPFVSYGGTALMTLLALMGVVASVSRAAAPEPSRR